MAKTVLLDVSAVITTIRQFLEKWRVNDLGMPVEQVVELLFVYQLQNDASCLDTIRKTFYETGIPIYEVEEKVLTLLWKWTPMFTKTLENVFGFEGNLFRITVEGTTMTVRRFAAPVKNPYHEFCEEVTRRLEAGEEIPEFVLRYAGVK